MRKVRYVHWQRDDMWLGYLEEFPDYWTQGKSLDDMLQPYRHVYLEALAHRRALKIVVALKHYRTIRGHWPQDLGMITSVVPAEAFTDPVNDSSFLYRRHGSTFRFYSKGKNGIDENGQYTLITDPNSLKVVVKEDDTPFWPPMAPNDCTK